MIVDLVVSSREVFGSDRSALRLTGVLGELGATVRLIVPAHRPDRGFYGLVAGTHDILSDRVILATSAGLEGVWSRPSSRRSPDITILNSSSILACPTSRGGRSVLVLREWLDVTRLTHRALAKWHGHRVDAVVAISEGAADQWVRAGGGGTPIIVPNWLTDPWLDEEPSVVGSRRGIVCVGRFNAWKGQDVLGQAWVSAFASDTSAAPQLTFVGAEESGEFARRAAAIRTTGTDYGWRVMPRLDDIRPILQGSALVVVPSLHPEPFGNVVLEGLAAGCKVIAFEGGGPSDISRYVPTDALQVIPRGTVNLTRALREWYESGGAPQSPSTYPTTRAILRSRYSRQAAIAAWRTILCGLDSTSSAFLNP